jgi:DNA-3-methyladenine glycosylase
MEQDAQKIRRSSAEALQGAPFSLSKRKGREASTAAHAKPLGFPGLDFETWETSATGGAKSQLPGLLLPRAFFEAPTERVAPRLLGKVLAHRTETGWLVGRIVEVEAYLGPHHKTPDPAAHTHRGPTPRNQVIFGPAGHAYVYSIYGRYFCMNITCEADGRAGCVLVRALEPLAGMEQMAENRGLAPGAHSGCVLTSGPSRLCQALELDRLTHNGLDLLDRTSPLQVRDDGFRALKVMVTPRIGIRHAVDLPLRFALAEHACVSGPKRFKGKCIFVR